MYMKKTKMEEGAIVLCTVKKILPHSVFVSLDEYPNKEGMIHISEISPGRIRTLRDFVKEGKKIVCKILKIDKDHIDLSLRRVTTSVRINKLTELKQEEKAEKLLKMIGERLKKTLLDMYKEIGNDIIEQYGSLNSFFQEISENKKPELEMEKKTLEAIREIVKEKIKPPEVKVHGCLLLEDTSPNGIDHIKKALLIENKDTGISYISAPRYRIEVTSRDYKTAEAILKRATEEIISSIEKSGGKGEFKHG